MQKVRSQNVLKLKLFFLSRVWYKYFILNLQALNSQTNTCCTLNLQFKSCKIKNTADKQRVLIT